MPQPSSRTDHQNSNADTDAKAAKPAKASYRKPTIRTESLTAVAAVCNGIAGSGRKASTLSPSFCSSTKIKS